MPSKLASAPQWKYPAPEKSLLEKPQVELGMCNATIVSAVHKTDHVPLAYIFYLINAAIGDLHEVTNYLL